MGKKNNKKSAKKAAKSEIKKGKAEAATTATDEASEKKSKKQKTEAKIVSVAEPKASLGPEKVKTQGLPEHVTKHRIETRSTVSDGVHYINLEDVSGTSTTVYVNDIHAAVPTILEQVYWVNMQGERWPIGRISKEDYEFILKYSKGRLPEDRHVFAVVDCAVDPTLSYGWRLPELKGLPFPTLDMIYEEDKAFKNNPTYIHNRTPKFKLRETEKPDPKPEAEDEEEDFIITDDEPAEEPANDEEEFEFTDD